MSWLGVVKCQKIPLHFLQKGEESIITSDLKEVALFLAARCQRQEAISHNNREHINGLSVGAIM